MIKMSSIPPPSSSSIPFLQSLGEFDANMPMVSVPWSQPASVVVILLGEHISQHTALNLSYSISFVGPLLLGGLVWDILTTDVALALQSLVGCIGGVRNGKDKGNRLRSSSDQSKDSVQSQAPQRETEPRNLILSSFIDRSQSDERERDEQMQIANLDKQVTVKVLSVLNRLCSFLARASALALITLYIAYTHGDHEIQCGSWPHTIVGLGAIATSMITVSIFINAFLAFPEASQWLFFPLSFFALAQFGMSFATVAAWRGGLRPSGVACYLRISRWSGIFHLGNLIFFVFLPFFFFCQNSSLSVTKNKNGHKRKTSTIVENSDTYAAVISGALSNALSKLNRERLTKRNRVSSLTATGSGVAIAKTLQDPLPSNPDQVKDWITARLATSTRDLSAKEGDEKCAVQSDMEGILILPGQPTSSYGSKAHTICVSEPTNVWADYIFWWFLAFCTALCGTIICFANWSGILTFSYFPVSVVLFVLFCQRLTTSPNRVFVTGQKVNLADFNKSDEGHRRNRLGSSPMSVRLAAAASTSATLKAEDSVRKPVRTSSLPRRSSAADATATKFREIFPVQQKSLRSSLERALPTRKPVPTDYAHTSAESVTVADEDTRERDGNDFSARFSGAVGTLMRKSSNFSLKSRIVQLMRESSNQGRPSSVGNGSDLEDGLRGFYVHENQQDPLMKLAAQGLTSSSYSSSTHPNRISPSTKRSSGSSGQPGHQARSPPQESSMEDVNNQLHDEKLSRNLLKFNSPTERKTRKSSPAMLSIRPNLERKNGGALDVPISPPKTAASIRTLADDHSLPRHSKIWSEQPTDDSLWTSLTDDESQYKQGLQPRYRQRRRLVLNGPVTGKMYDLDALLSTNIPESTSNDTTHSRSDHTSLPHSPAMQSEESEITLPISPQVVQRAYTAVKPLMPLGYRSTTLSPTLEVNERPSSFLQQSAPSSIASNQLSTMRKGTKSSINDRNRSESVGNASQEHQATYDTFGNYGNVSMDYVPGIASYQNTTDVPLVASYQNTTDVPLLVPNDSPEAHVTTGRDRGLSNPNSISSVMLIGQVPAHANRTKSEVETFDYSVAGKEGHDSKSSSSKKVPSSEANSSSGGSLSVYHSPNTSFSFSIAQGAMGVPLPNLTNLQEDAIMGMPTSNLSATAVPLTTIDSLRDLENEEEMENLRSNDSRYLERRTDIKGKQKAEEDIEDTYKGEVQGKKLDKSEQFLQEAKLGDSINLSDDVDIDQQPDWVLADEKRKEKERKLDQALKAGIEMADEDVLSIFLDKRGFSRSQAEELNAHRNERRKKRLSREGPTQSMRSAPTEMQRILSGGTTSTYHEDDEISSASESSTSQMQHDKLSHARTSPAMGKKGQDQYSEASFGLHDIADNPKLKERSIRSLSPSSQKASSRKKLKQKERARSPDQLQIRAAEAVVQAAPHRSSVHIQKNAEVHKTASGDDLFRGASENVSPLVIPSASISPLATKLPSPMEQVDKPILEHKRSFGQVTTGGFSVESDNSSRGASVKRQLYLRQNSGSHSTFSSDRRNQQSSSSNSGSAAVSEHGDSISTRSPMTGMGERGGIDIVKKHVLPKINTASSPVVTPQSALIALAGPPSHPPTIPLPPPPPESEMNPKDLSPISGNSMGAISSTSLNNQRTLERVEEDSGDSRPSTPEMAAKAKAIVRQKRMTPQRNESNTSILNSAKEDDSIAGSSAYESDEKLPGSKKRFKSKQRRGK
ncbi:uncharacterized protein FA14DRAFT_93073 [Meira miltonrushii]|uniref:Uncharacterized protein n=1 Tax=Meira miltonrushii TaxID=1280837 RepID=A0A316V466_9BASI|nr:uncharacterized protein FA14DRAFT_93073 [Meira miltonrushii]PWN31798.1 hypothetical protein FA14DRAFT_93073 [Meira miltonrushii]